MRRVITIGREFGSGGRELARRLAEGLGIEYYDRAIVREIAKRTELEEGYVDSVLEKASLSKFPITEGRTFYDLNDPVFDMRQSIYLTQTNIIKEMAERSDCVIVGRCAEHILKDYDPLKIFVYASLESRLKRCRERGPEEEDLTDKELLKKIKGIDKRRAKFYKGFTGDDWGDRRNYDLLINTSFRDIKSIIPPLINYIEESAKVYFKAD